MSKKLDEIVNKFKTNEKNIERRFFSKTEFRVSDDGKKIVGYAAKFNELSPQYYGFKEKISPGAFTKTIKEADIRALFNHDPNIVLGRNKAGTLKLEEDEIGLRYEIELPDTQHGIDLHKLVKRGDISQSSFGFRIIKHSWEEDETEGIIHTIIEVKLFDVSPVTYPWYPTTEASARAAMTNQGYTDEEIIKSLIKLNNNLNLKEEDLRNLKKYVTNITERILTQKEMEPPQKHSAQENQEPPTHSESDEPLKETNSHSDDIATRDCESKTIQAELNQIS